MRTPARAVSLQVRCGVAGVGISSKARTEAIMQLWEDALGMKEERA